MTNHKPVFTSSSATGSFTETANTTDSMTPHLLSGTMNFTDSDHSDTHTTSAALKSAVVSGGTTIPASALAHLQAAMSSQITSDSNGSGKLKWSFSDADDDFDFLAKNQTLVLTYDIKVSDNHGGTTTQTVKITVTGTDDKPVISMAAAAIVSEQAGHTLSLSPDIAHVTLNFVDQDLANTGHTATVTGASATGNISGLLPGALGTAELMAFLHVDGVVKNSGSSSGTINTTFAAPDLAFDYLASGEQLNITYAVQLDDHAGGTSTQNVMVTVIGTNDKPVFLCGPDTEHLAEGQDIDPSGNLTADGDLLFSDVDLNDTHTVSTTVTASRSGGGAVPIPDAALLAAFSASLGPDSTGHVLGEVDWQFALANTSISFLNSGETLTLVYQVKVQDPSGAIDTQDVTITILGTNDPVVITSGPQSSTVSELADTTGSASIDTTPTVPAGTLAFTDTDIGDTHAVAVTLDSTSGSAVPAATQADLATALTTVLIDSTGTGSGSIDWNFAIPDLDLDYLADGETLTVNYNIKVSDAATSSTQAVSVVITGANDAVAMTSGPGSASLAEQPGVTGSTSLDTTSPDPTGALNFADVDLSDVHSIGVTLNSAVWSASSGFVPADTIGALQTSLITALHDSTGTGSGAVDWTFSIADLNLDFLSAGETLTVTYDVTVYDGSTSSTQQVSIVIDGAADPFIVTPVTVAVTDTANTDDGLLLASGAIADIAHAVDSSTPRTITEVNGSAANVGTLVAGAYGSLLLNVDGTYAYVANAAVDPLQVGSNPTDQFTFQVDDGQGNTTTTTLTFNVTGVDDNPVITAADAFATLTEDAGPSIAVNGGFESGNLSGWIASGVTVDPTFSGGELGNYSARLFGSGFLEQDVVTTPGQQYSLSFYVAGDTEASSTSFTVYWDGVPILAQANVALGYTKYTFDVVSDALDPTTQLFFDFSGDGTGLLVDQISISPTPGPAVETASGSIAFSDIETGDTHTASFVPQGSGYVGTFSLDPVTESGGTGSVGWQFSVDNADIQFLGQNDTLVQSYTVMIDDGQGGTVAQTVTVAINGTNDAPTAVGETIITDAGSSSLVQIQPWMLAANDTDPDLTDNLAFGSIQSSTGGFAVTFGDVFFGDDATDGGSFTYTVSDGIATSGNAATATVINNATSTTSLNGTSDDDIIIATNSAETLSGGGGNDILVGNAGGHVMSGGTGNDTFAFLQTTDGPGTITDFNNTTEQDHIAISASGFGGALTPGMDISALFETSGDDQFSGSGAQFHFDTGNQTLYFSADGTQASAIAVTTVQPGGVLNPHDLLIV